MSKEPFQPDDIVKTCCKLESGLFLHIEGLRSCSRGALMAPIFYTTDELNQAIPTKELIVLKRKQLIEMLNDNHSDMDCKRCLMVVQKRYGDIDFSRLDHVDLQHYSACNLRCSYCHYTRKNVYIPPQYEALAVLDLFSSDDIEWNAHVDFAGGEPTLLENMGEYLKFFRSRRIRVLMFTNAVKFSQEIYDGLANGSIYFVITSLDAGTPTTYKSLRGRDYYMQVVENLSRYAAAGSKGKGMLAVKYIFCDTNCSDDDIAGFAYTMLALRPQQVWLTFDFAPMFLGQSDYDYNKLIEAYAKLYLLLKKHGIDAFHYFKEAVATVSQEGKDIMDRVNAAIDRRSAMTLLGVSDLVFQNFRNREKLIVSKPGRFRLSPLRFAGSDGEFDKWSLEGKRVLLVPACPQAVNLLDDPDIQQAGWIGFIDRNPTQQGKEILGRMIYSYETIASLNPDVILVAAPEKHRVDIINALAHHAPLGSTTAELSN